jgi:hypothetical protein
MYTATLTIDNILDPTPINLQSEMTARELIEAAFVQLQTGATPDPFTITIAYYGYDYYNGVTTYLGYFIVSMSITQGTTKKVYASGADSYWELFVSDTMSQEGMDSVLVEPNDRIALRWITPPVDDKQAATRLQRVLARNSTDSPRPATSA